MLRRPFRPRSIAPLATLFLFAGSAWWARADLGPRHVHVPGLADSDVQLIIENLDGEPIGLVAGGDLVSRPTGGAMRDDEEMLASAGAAASEPGPAPEIRPDRMTSTVTATDYFEAFTPAIAPYKRVAAYDAVRLDPDGTPVLHVARNEPEAMSIGGGSPRVATPRDAFWGTVMLDFRDGRRVGIPSVAPDARILHVRTEPAIDLVLGRDSAGNHYADSLEPGAGIVRLTFLTDAPRGFFGQAIPAVRTDTLAARVPVVPDDVRRRALEFAAELGVGPSSPLDVTLDALVAHFRGFVEDDTIPGQTGDAYLDLARGGVGVCRHRAYAFTVTALGLGIPTRYVQNEAHAWVEVELPSRGFLRIDLGGSATAVNAHGLQDRPRHEVLASDPFPQPEVFVRDYLHRSVAPLDAPTQGAPGAETSASEGTQSTGDATGAGSSGAAQGTAEPPSSDGPDTSSSEVPGGTTMAAPAEASDQPGAHPGEQAAAPDRLATTLELAASSLRVYRGQMLDLAGSVRASDGRAVVRGRIEIRVGESRLLGVALTDEQGHFALSLGIPPDLGLGGHPLRIEFVGNPAFAPSAAP